MAGSVPENVIVMWPGSHADANNLTGWSRETTLDSKMTKGVSGVDVDAGVSGGAGSHDHATAAHTHPEAAHTHGGASGIDDNQNDSSVGSLGNAHGADHNHTHNITTASSAGPTSGASTPAWGSTAIEPPYYTVIYIKSDGTGDGFPDDCIVYYDSGTDPTNWTQHSASVDKYFRGAATGAAGGGTGGSATHTHTTAAHTHSAGAHSHGASNSGGSNVKLAGGNSGTWASHVVATTHTVAATSSSGAVTSSALSGGVSASQNNIPPSTKMNAIQNTSGASVWLENAFCLFLGTASAATDTGFTKCDGNNETRNLLNQFILNEPANNSGHGGTSGAINHGHTTAGHTHTANHAHGNVALGNVAADGVYKRNSTSGGSPTLAHGHSAAATTGTAASLTTTSPTLTDKSDEQPSHYTLHYLMSGEEPVSAGGSAAMFGANF
jgi:hypothetical protein